ncbi:hypothetical protein [Alkanindiges illinoisensis]|uniref:Uncharacterized protein n=1 Tax=Alkanindiges illinoisensis TaxID=197183 RepID=A0A4Y7X9W8_9GAMM|nr:hypothetical protein [Alkanindiges illinoisensis]TEU23863.1 hypothetical protein E2B99_13065 [Alkanindiges illinoisensis]
MLKKDKIYLKIYYPILTFIFLSISTLSHADRIEDVYSRNTQQCSSYLNQKISPDSFDFYAKKLKSIPKIKGEFETTSEYIERSTAKFKDLAIPNILILEIPLDRKFITYDADNKILTYEKYSVDNENTTYADNFTPPGQDLGGMHYIEAWDLHIGRSTLNKKSFTARNVFDKNVLVSQVEITSKSIFDELKSPYSKYKNLDDRPLFKFINLMPHEAKRLKESSRAFAVIFPKSPYFIEAEGPPTTPTITNPLTINYKNQVLVADINCILLTEDDGTVFSSTLEHTKAYLKH